VNWELRFPPPRDFDVSTHFFGPEDLGLGTVSKDVAWLHEYNKFRIRAASVTQVPKFRA
jgi:hypothetical protein